MAQALDPVLWYLGLFCGAAALTLAVAHLQKPDAADASMPRPLNDLLTFIFGWIGIVTLFLPSIFFYGPGRPVITIVVLGVASWLALRYLRLMPVYRHKFALAIAATGLAVLYWL